MGVVIAMVIVCLICDILWFSSKFLKQISEKRRRSGNERHGGGR
jgi:uncharacterized membrane protein